MHIYKTTNGILVNDEGNYYLLQKDWDQFINRKGLHQHIKADLQGAAATKILADTGENTLPPIGTQEVWAAGVTYLRSREARMEESKDAGGGDFYARVYEAERPELFFKSTAARVVGPGGPVRIRRDSAWNVPEPELTLFVSSEGSIEGYTVGNDMSSRDIEGDNPLYLPQAKTYDGSAALGPCLYVPETPIDADALISIAIGRNGETVFAGSISINRMKRKHDELVGFLFRELSFSTGVFLMTGTGLVPPDNFTLALADEIRITIDGIGTLVNTVTQ